ncbi:hypothetical protein VTH06DRAFT_1467 [Thermothelomyces fergusii]
MYLPILPQTPGLPGFWIPPPDPEKPDCPYRVGFQVEIKQHTPPLPFGGRSYGPGAWRQRRDVDLYSATQTEVVMSYPPLERESGVPSPIGSTATLTITETLAVGDGRGAQVVVCSVAPEPHRRPFVAVAKIFDALYYSFVSRVGGAVPCNTARSADVDYSREAAALDHLRMARRKGLSLTAPEFFGSWTFSLPITHAGKNLLRPVRLVLMEHIEGPNMLAVCRDPDVLSIYSEEDRVEILARVLEEYMRQRYAGVDQRDLAARNVVLRPDPSSSLLSASSKKPLPQPVLIDYADSVVFELSRFGKLHSQDEELPQNPMEFFWKTNFDGFIGWMPSRWNRSYRQRQKWLKERFGGEKVSHYAPVVENLKFSDD